MTAAFARRSPAAVVAALATIYLVWGSTYLAIRVTDRTMPPLLMSSVRFLIAGLALYAFASRGRPRPTLREWQAAAIVGAALLMVGNGGVAWVETRLESGLAALIVAVIPLWFAVMDRAFFGKRLSTPAIAGLVVGFGGVALLVHPGGGAHVLPMLALLVTTAACPRARSCLPQCRCWPRVPSSPSRGWRKERPGRSTQTRSRRSR